MNTYWLKSQIEKEINKNILITWLNGYGNVETKLTKNARLVGATNAVLFQVDSKIRFAVKYHTDDVPDEKKGYEILAAGYPVFARQHLVPVLFRDDIERSTLLLPYLLSTSLHEVIAEKKAQPSWLIDYFYTDFLNEMRTLWNKTKTKTPPNLHAIYLKRINDRCAELQDFYALDDIRGMELVVNDQYYGTLGDIISSVNKKLRNISSSLKYSCTIHGDEHAKNILIKDSDLETFQKSWVIIDCVKVQKNYDWVFSIGKMLHWWLVYYAIENYKKNNNKSLNCKLIVGKKKHRIQSFYNEKEFSKLIPNICSELKDKVLTFTRRVGEETFKEDKNVLHERLQIALFSILFGSIPRHFKKNDRFAIPILLGESLKYLNKHSI